MARECFENDEIASILNSLFICIKIDRDERPDIDRRYQNAVMAMGGGGGWPLSVFLTSEKKPFFGGTYFPPEDNMGRPGFKKILKTISEIYRTKKPELIEISNKLMDSLKNIGSEKDEIKESTLQEAMLKMLSFLDMNHGGFGTAPKFPMTGALEFLLNRYFLSGFESVGSAVMMSLEKMSKGGYYDQVGGGFHRYSVDAEWIIPHFEKMAEDNAWLLRNYIQAYSLSGNDIFKKTAEGIIYFVKTVLSDPEGGFYSSQDADITSDDEGGYFTWSTNELKELLSDEEYKIFSLHMLSDKGRMHHDKSKIVLFNAVDIEKVSIITGIGAEEIKELLSSAMKKLLERRSRRPAPFVDKTFYTSLNGIMASSFIKASYILQDDNLKYFAIKSIERIKSLFLKDDRVYHTENIEGIIDDYIYLIEALIDIYEATAVKEHLECAEKLMNLCLEKFWDHKSGGFYDTETDVLDMRLKNILDMPHPSVNASGILLLLRLSLMTNKNEYFRYAEEGLKFFALQAEEAGLNAAYYYCALDAYFNALKLDIRAGDNSNLTKAARTIFYPYKSIIYGEDEGSVIPCIHNICYEPIRETNGLEDFINNLRGR